MNILKRHKEIPIDCWLNESQKMELKIWNLAPSMKEDRNTWWKNLFNNYDFIKNENIKTLLEAGCGPFAKNTQFIIQTLINKPKKIILNDPLLSEYIKINKPVAEFIKNNNIEQHSCPLEKLSIDPVDMIIVINVLDHVYNLDECFKSIGRNLNSKGILILGNDLTNEDNFNNTAKNDPNAMLHPIRFDYSDIKNYLDEYSPIYERVVENKDPHHYATLIYIGRKK